MGGGGGAGGTVVRNRATHRTHGETTVLRAEAHRTRAVEEGGLLCKNKHSKDKGDPAVTLPDSGGLSATLRQRVVIVALAAAVLHLYACTSDRCERHRS